MFLAGARSEVSFLENPRTLYPLCLVWGVFAWLLIWRLPYVCRAVFGIPALEYDGRTLIIRGWDTHRLSSMDLSGARAAYDEAGAIVLTAPALAKPIIIDLNWVWEGPTITLLESAIGREIERDARALPVEPEPVLTEAQKAAEIRRKASGYFLIGIGLPIAGAFIYPWMPMRRGPPLLEMADLSISEGNVFLIGAAVGLVMTVLGYVILKWKGRR